MYAAITTRYLGPTNFRGSRVVANAGDGRKVTLEWRPELNVEQNHRRAAYALRNKLKWTGDLIGGWNDNTGLWVFSDTPYAPEPTPEAQA